jgi:hypothetical protein
MTTPIAFAAGMGLTAAEMNEIQPLQVIKQAPQSVTSSTTLVNDTALLVSLPVASAQYIFRSMFYFTGGTRGSSDLKYNWSIPSGASLAFALNGIGTGGGSFDGDGFSGSGALGTQGATQCAALFYGSLIVGTTTGTLQLQWAQNTSSGTATTMQAGSVLELMRVS